MSCRLKFELISIVNKNYKAELQPLKPEILLFNNIIVLFFISLNFIFFNVFELSI